MLVEPMLSTFHIFLIAALFCLVMVLVLSSLLRTGIPGVKEWTVANATALAAFILYAFGTELPPLIAYEIANGAYAAAAATMLLGFRRFFLRDISVAVMAAGVVLLMAAIGIFHYQFDSFALRTLMVSIFQGGICVTIAVAIFQSGKARRSRYPCRFTAVMAILWALGHGVRAVVHMLGAHELTSLLQPSPWNQFFLSLGVLMLPTLTLGGVLMVHDMMMVKAEHAANRDFLTGAWSRRAFFELVDRELTRTVRSGRPVSLLMLDVDNFKPINDTFGHAAGDQVLVDIVLRAETVIRSIDYFARIGGEEFAVLLPETDHAAALLVAERLRSNLDRRQPDSNAKGEISTAPYTVSIGVATLRDGESFQALMRRADAALYEAKVSGRNLVVASQI